MPHEYSEQVIFTPVATPPSLIHLTAISPPKLLIHLLSSKEKAYCPSWERKKNTSRARFSDAVRLKAATDTTQMTPRRTMDSTSVERSAKIKTTCIHDNLYRQPKRSLGRLTVVADL